jgi:hypothetical protein
VKPHVTRRKLKPVEPGCFWSKTRKNWVQKGQ